jgi:hypothetical protein
VIEVSADSHPDLFWTGQSGGDFGIVAFPVYDIGPMCIWVSVYKPGADGALGTRLRGRGAYPAARRRLARRAQTRHVGPAVRLARLRRRYGRRRDRSAGRLLRDLTTEAEVEIIYLGDVPEADEAVSNHGDMPG